MGSISTNILEIWSLFWNSLQILSLFSVWCEKKWQKSSRKNWIWREKILCHNPDKRIQSREVKIQNSKIFLYLSLRIHSILLKTESVSESECWFWDKTHHLRGEESWGTSWSQHLWGKKLWILGSCQNVGCWQKGENFFLSCDTATIFLHHGAFWWRLTGDAAERWASVGLA